MWPRFTLTIDLRNGTWYEGDDVSLDALGQAMQDVAKLLWSGCEEGRIVDSEGSPSGEFSIQTTESEER